MCESGDVFTRDDRELLDPRSLPTPAVGDFIAIHDAGAYGEAMSSNYVSLGRVPQVWYDNGKAHLSSRRQTLEDILRTECFEEL
jgi:diaminopimelate decarboxylase